MAMTEITQQFKTLGDKVVLEAFKVGDVEGSYITNEFAKALRVFKKGIEFLDAGAMLDVCLHIENDITVYEIQKKPVKALKRAFADLERFTLRYLKEKHDVGLA